MPYRAVAQGGPPISVGAAHELLTLGVGSITTTASSSLTPSDLSRSGCEPLTFTMEQLPQQLVLLRVGEPSSLGTTAAGCIQRRTFLL